MKCYSQDNSEYENHYDAGIEGLFLAIINIDKCNGDFKTFALFHIKSSINKYINDKD